MSFDKEIQQLSAFTSNKHVPAIIQNLKHVCRKQGFSLFGNGTMALHHSTVTTLRHQLQTILNEEEKLNDITIQPELGDLCHRILLKLAYNSPINSEDPSSLMAIDKKDQVCLSTGHQYDINTLVKFHDVRAPNDNERRQNFKMMANYAINQPCSFRDITHIKAVAAERNIAIEDLIDHSGTALKLQKLAAEYKQLLNNISDEQLANHLFKHALFQHLLKNDIASTFKAAAACKVRFENSANILLSFFFYNVCGVSFFIATYIVDLIFEEMASSYDATDTFIQQTSIAQIGLLTAFLILVYTLTSAIHDCKTKPTLIEDIKQVIIAAP